MIKKADIVILEAKNKISNNYNLVEKARRKGIKLIELFEDKHKD